MKTERAPTRARVEAAFVLVLLLGGVAFVGAFFSSFPPFLLVLFFWFSPIVVMLLAIYTFTLREEVKSLKQRVEDLEGRTQGPGS